MSSDKVSNDVFNLFKEYTEKHFNTLHECDKRIETKIDSLVKTLGERQEKKEERKFTRQQALFGAIIALISSGIMWAINRVFGQ